MVTWTLVSEGLPSMLCVELHNRIELMFNDLPGQRTGGSAECYSVQTFVAFLPFRKITVSPVRPPCTVFVHPFRSPGKRKGPVGGAPEYRRGREWARPKKSET